MDIVLYNNRSDNRDMNKSLQQLLSLSNVHPVEGFDVINPKIKLGSVNFTSLKNVNYAYIPDYNRYYYVDGPVITNNGVYYLSLSVDPLMSFKSAIRALTVIVDKTQNNNKANFNFNDGTFINQEGKFLEVEIFPTGFADQPSNVLMVAGG